MSSKSILVGLDFETYYAKDFSLRRIAMANYIRDPDRFKVHGCAVKVADYPARWLTEPQFRAFAPKMAEMGNIYLYGHNLKFDGAIAAWHYGIRPKMYLDTLGISRAVIGSRIKSHSLDTVAKHFGFGGKVKQYALSATLGKWDLDETTMRYLGEYACDDITDTHGILFKMLPDFPVGEIEVLDWTIRMFVEPALVLNHPVLHALHQGEILRKQEILDEVGVDRKALNSNQQFAEMLARLGVAPPLKISPRTGKATYAFAAKDEEFIALLDHEDERVSTLVGARLGTKSSIEETRAKSYADIAATGLPWPVDLHYSGAMATHRLSGGKGGGGNVQNLGRKSMLRQAIMAPEGFTLVVADSSNIELRTSAAICGQWDIIDTLAAGKDLYSAFATRLFGFEVNKKDHPDERQVGKVAVLQLGYQSGDATFDAAYWAQTGQKLPAGESKRVVTVYRETYSEFPITWAALQDRLKLMARGTVPENLPSAPPLIWQTDRIIGPSGLAVKYPELRIEEIPDKKRGGTKNNMVYTAHGKTVDGMKPIYGGMVLENLSQFMAREVMTWQAKIINRRYRVLMQVHDELVVLCPLGEEEECAAFVKEVMSTTPPWWPRLVVSCEVQTARIYGQAK